jgi:hypothetical protein
MVPIKKAFASANAFLFDVILNHSENMIQQEKLNFING